MRIARLNGHKTMRFVWYDLRNHFIGKRQKQAQTVRSLMSQERGIGRIRQVKSRLLCFKGVS